MLSTDGLNYGFYPKGLLPFHKYGKDTATPFEELHPRQVGVADRSFLDLPGLHGVRGGAPAGAREEVHDARPSAREMEPEPPGIARVLLHPVHGALRHLSRSVAERRDAPEEIREVQRSEQLARDFVLRRDAECGGASSRASSKIPHVHHPAPRPREHRLAVRAHPHAVHGRFRVRGGDELGAGFSAGAARVPEVTSSLAT